VSGFQVGDSVIVHPADDRLAERFDGKRGVIQSIVESGPLEGALYVLLETEDKDAHLLGVGPECAELAA
jgi:hypothetical protein